MFISNYRTTSGVNNSSLQIPQESKKLTMRGQLIVSVFLVWAFCAQGSQAQAIWKNITGNTPRCVVGRACGLHKQMTNKRKEKMKRIKEMTFL